ncbi:hypothetical protein CWR48_14180 [Oceanobacillus arenosus]|uniref:RNase H type-1 domain-containing protein n=1 Tax=Oceanobacillus arenosus TaxID=1229153 RepID=A0A3D8PQ01_9BACI|nr:reverse transcriptase-like protein [Oceanobacillus arenosus]RDW17341.1 hypothetical protein CWR48_14180 [Oceanobacillus arenosus]
MNIKIELTYKTVKGTEARFISDEMRAEKAMLIAEDLEKTGRAKVLSFIDHLDNRWTMKELKKFMQGIETDPHNVTVFFDGGFDLKSRKSGLGCAIYYEQSGKKYRQRINAAVEELETNNEAEYAAFHLGLQEIEQLGVHHLPVIFVGDSLVVINQLNGEWPVYEVELSKWIDRIETQLKRLGITPEYEIISRKKNKETDHLATQAMNGIEIRSTVEIDAGK